MKKQLIIAGAGLLLVIILFVAGKTAQEHDHSAHASPVAKTFEVNATIDSLRTTLSPQQSVILSELENNITRGDVTDQKIKAYTSIANFWKDSIKNFDAYAYYISEGSKLDNSEKNLTFAARLLLNNLRHEQDEARLNWQTGEAIDLYERALKINPENDDLRVELGSVYVYGRGRSGDPEATMKGIQELLTVARKDSNNMKAQLVLGIGGMVSGQYDKALERFHRIVQHQPGNLEAIAYLADTYAAKGDKTEAVKWYNISKKVANNPAFSKEVDERIKQLR